jgi:hypothetical protein
MSAEIIPFRPRTMRTGHEFFCTGSGRTVWSAVHWGPIDVCLPCQTFGSEMVRMLDAHSAGVPSA